MINSSCPSYLITRGVLQDPPGPPRPPPGPPRLPGPPGPPGLPKFGRVSAAFKPSRNWATSSEPLLSESHSANHFSNVPFNSARVSEPSLSVSAALKRPGPTNRPGPAPPPPRRDPPPAGPPPWGPNPWGGGRTSASLSVN